MAFHTWVELWIWGIWLDGTWVILAFSSWIWEISFSEVCNGAFLEASCKKVFSFSFSRVSWAVSYDIAFSWVACKLVLKAPHRLWWVARKWWGLLGIHSHHQSHLSQPQGMNHMWFLLELCRSLLDFCKLLGVRNAACDFYFLCSERILSLNPKGYNTEKIPEKLKINY